MDTAGTSEELNQYIGGGSGIRAKGLAADFAQNILESAIVSSKLE